ncbi:protein TASOR [Aulostomus maculatus]
MDDREPFQREIPRPRRVSAAAEIGANAGLQDGEVIEVHPTRETPGGWDVLGAPAWRTERRNSAPQVVHQRHMPKEPGKFHIPRKTKEKKALFQYVSTESREFEDMMSILTSSYVDANSAACFAYNKPRLVHSELLEKEFVEKRREMKADGRTDNELGESYCFLLAEAARLPLLCEKGLPVGQSWMSGLGHPQKGVYLSRYSDLLQVNSFNPGATGEILIFKVMKGKVKSIFDNMKSALDPTPRFDSHISKNASKVTSLTVYRAFELTQQYFYEYVFDELRERPRHVCPYAVVSFLFKGKDSSLPSKPLAPIRSNSQSAEVSKERAQYTVWTGDLVKEDKVLFQISLRSSSPPFLPHRLPEKLEMGCLIRLDQVTKLLPADLFSYNLYNGSQEVVKNGLCSSLLEVTDKCRSTTSVKRLLQELEIKRVVLVTPLTDRGFLILLSSVQMAPPAERGESWRRCLQALFVFPETRDMAKSSPTGAASSCAASEPLMSGGPVMPGLNKFLPALHHALVKARANPPPELSTGVERQAREYLTGQSDSKARQYPMGEYDTKLDEHGQPFPVPKHHRLNLDGYLRSYLYSPVLYQLSVARARRMMEAHCGLEAPREVRAWQSRGGELERTGRMTGNTRDGETNSQKMQQMIDLVLTCERNAANEVWKEEEREGAVETPGRKRRLEQKTAERALKYLKASQKHAGCDKIPVEGGPASGPPDSLTSVINLMGLKDVDLREEKSELATKLFRLLTGLSQAARGTANQARADALEEFQGELCPFDSLANKLGLPINCDIDLRKQEELEEQMAGSISSLEGFSPSGEVNHHGPPGRGGGLLRRAGGYEAEEEGLIPWVLIPITGLSSQRYTQRDRNIPQDPRFHHIVMATGIITTTKPPGTSPTPSPEHSPPASPPLPPPSLSQCPSPAPSPLPSPSQCPSPQPSPPPSPSQCPSPEPSPPRSPSRYLFPPRHPPPSPSQHPSHQLSRSAPHPRCQSPEPNNHSPHNEGHNCANKQPFAPKGSLEFAGMTRNAEQKPLGKEQQSEDSSVSSSIKLSVPSAADRTVPSLSPKMQSQQAGGTRVEGMQAEPLKKAKESQLCEKLHKGGEEEAVEASQDEGNDLIHRVANEMLGGSSDSASAVSPPACPLSDIDGIVDKHQADFSSDMHLLLQEESVQYSFPKPPHCSSNTPTTSSQHALPTAVSPFSQYVSFYNPCPRVQDYVSSLHDDINSMMKELDDRWHIDLSVTRNSRKTPENPPTTRAACSVTGEEAGSSLAGAEFQATLPGLNSVSKPFVEPPQPSEQASSQGSMSITGPGTDPVPQSSALSSLINQLQPEVFNNLWEIVKDVKKHSRQFYIHGTKPKDQVLEDIKEYLLRQGYVEQSPVAFMNQEKSDSRLLVIIKNKDIAGHVHKIPGLVSLKQHHLVVFVGIDSLDDIRNRSYNELFVAGGCVVSDDFALNPDVTSPDRLAALLMFLEKQSSSGSVWRWKVHCKAHKKLKEQARFRRDAADILDLLSAYHKRQIVEFLPYHNCDMVNHQSPDLDCLIELQARYTQYRHTLVLTERFERFPAYSSSGIVMARIDDVLHNFDKLVGYQDIKGKQLITEDLLPSKEHVRPLTAGEQVQHLLQQSGSNLSYISDQLVPEASYKEGVPRHSDKELEMLQMAISQLRAERRAQQQRQQQQQLQSQAEFSTNLPINFHPVPVAVGSSCITPPLDQGGCPESVHLTPGRKAVAATLELIHSTLQTEAEEGQWKEGRAGAEPPTEGQMRGGGRREGEPRDEGGDTSVAPLGRSQGSRCIDTSSSGPPSATSSNQIPATAAAPRYHMDSASNRKEPIVSSSTTSCPAEGDRPRDSPSGREQPMRREGSAPAHNVVLVSSSTQATGNAAMVTEQERKLSRAQPRLQQLQHLPTNPLQQLSEPFRPSLSHPPYNQQRWGGSLLQQPRLPFSPSPPPGHLAALGGVRSLLGTPVWPGGLVPAGAALVWGFQQPGRDLIGPGLLGGYQNPSGQGHRGGLHRGGGFNGM